MRRMISIGTMLTLLAACGAPARPTAGPAPAPRVAQRTAAPQATIAATPTGVAETSVTGVVDPEWATFRFDTTYVQSTTGALNLLGWSPDSQRLLYRDRTRLFLFDRQQNTVVDLERDAIAAAWLPDSTGIAYVPFSEQHLLRRYTLATETTDDVVLPKDIAITALGTSNDEMILFTADTAFVIDDFATLDIKQKQFYQLINPGAYVIWSASGSKGIIVDEIQARVYLPDTNIDLQPYPRDGSVNAVWSPDEERISVGYLAQQVRILKSDGTLARLLRVAIHVGILAWNTNQDQDIIYNANKGGQSPYNAFILRMGEKESMQINEPLPDQSAVLQVAFAPDQRIVAYRALIHSPGAYSDQLVIRTIGGK